MPLRAARYRRAALSALLAAGALFLSACTVFGPPNSPSGEPSIALPGEGAAYLFYEESISGGRAGNAFFGRGELQPVVTGDTGGLVRVHDARFRRPVAVAAKDHWVYVVDADRQQVLLYDRFSGNMEVLADLKGVVTGDVADIFVTGDRTFYLADSVGGKVLKFDRNGRLLATFQDAMNLRRPVAVSVDETNGDVYVADGVLDHVVIFTSAGGLWRAIGGRGEEEGRFLNITSMVRGPDGVYVTARFVHRAQVLSQEGAFLYAFESDSLAFPNAVAVDAGNRAYVSDFIDNSIKLFERGKPVATVGGTGVGPGRFKGISDLWLEGGTLYVADSLNGRIQVFKIAAGENKTQ